MCRRCEWLFVLFLVQSVFLGTAVYAQSDEETAKPEVAPPAEASAPADPTGSWEWEYNFNDNVAEFFLTLDRDGDRVTGEYTAFDNTTDIEETKLVKDELSFMAKREFNGNEFVVHFNGKVKPDDIIGTVGVDFGEGPREFDWHAKRVVEIEDVLGRWALRLETPNGVIEPTITFTKSSNGLHGEYSSRFGDREAKNVQLKDNELTWEISSDDDDDFDFQVVYRGKPRGNKIQGTNEFDFGGNTGTMEFSGKRTPPEKKRAADATPASNATSAAAAAPDTESAPAETADATTP